MVRLILTSTAYRPGWEWDLQGGMHIGFGAGRSGGIDRTSNNDMKARQADNSDEDSHSELREHDGGCVSM